MAGRLDQALSLDQRPLHGAADTRPARASRPRARPALRGRAGAGRRSQLARLAAATGRAAVRTLPAIGDRPVRAADPGRLDERAVLASRSHPRERRDLRRPHRARSVQDRGRRGPASARAAARDGIARPPRRGRGPHQLDPEHRPGHARQGRRPIGDHGARDLRRAPTGARVRARRRLAGSREGGRGAAGSPPQGRDPPGARRRPRDPPRRHERAARGIDARPSRRSSAERRPRRAKPETPPRRRRRTARRFHRRRPTRRRDGAGRGDRRPASGAIGPDGSCRPARQVSRLRRRPQASDADEHRRFGDGAGRHRAHGSDRRLRRRRGARIRALETGPRREPGAGCFGQDRGGPCRPISTTARCRPARCRRPRLRSPTRSPAAIRSRPDRSRACRPLPPALRRPRRRVWLFRRACSRRLRAAMSPPNTNSATNTSTVDSSLAT